MNGVYSELIIVPVCTHVYRLSTHYTVFLISSQYPMSCLEFRFDTEWPKYELTDFIHIFVIGCKKKKNSLFRIGSNLWNYIVNDSNLTPTGTIFWINIIINSNLKE